MPWQADESQAGFTSAVEPWLPIPKDHLEDAVDRQTHQPNSLLNKYRQMIHWRKQQPALRQGTVTLIETAPPILGFIRQCDQQSIVCLFNISADPVQYDVSTFDPYTVDSATGFVNRRYAHLLEIPAYGVFLAELSP